MIIFAAMTPEGPTNFKMTEAYRQTYYPAWTPMMETAEEVPFPSLGELMAIAREPEASEVEGLEDGQAHEGQPLELEPI